MSEALWRLNLPVKDVMEVPLAELENALLSHRKAEERQMQTQWEIARFGWFIYINSKLKKAKQLKKPSDVMKFEWEKSEPVKNPKELLAEAQARAEKRKQRKNQKGS